MKKIAYTFFFALFLLVTLRPEGILAKEAGVVLNSSIDAIINRLEKQMSGVASVAASFVQEKELSIFNQKIILEGKMFLKKPALFAWHVFKPLRYSMVINGDSVRQWDEDSAQVQQLSIAKNPAFEIAITKMQDWFTGNYASLRKEYDITLVKSNPLTLCFVPMKDSLASNMIKRVTVIFQNDERYIDRIRIEEKNQDITLLKFFNTGLNVRIDAAAWEVKPRVQ